MRVAIVTFTRRGYALATCLADALALEGDLVSVRLPPRLANELGATSYGQLTQWVGRAFETCDALIFVSACGIAVRSVAPYVRDKMADPAVLCVDEVAAFVVPLLSGHVGGANALARRVSRICGAQAAITTATDVHGLFAVDAWAKAQGLAILDREAAKRVSARLLEGGSVGFASDFVVSGELPEGLVPGLTCPRPCDLGISISIDRTRRPYPQTLRLVPRVVRVGVGCRRGSASSTVARVVDACLERARVAPQAVCALATIDVKADEPGLVALASTRGWRMCCYTAEELASVPGAFSSSPFVLQTVGVDNVCERAACAEGATLVGGRHADEGVTVALAVAEPTLSFDVGEDGRES